MPQLATLAEWLGYIESLSVADIKLDLDQIKRVAKKLNLFNPDFKIITVAGTNGKGSNVALIESMLLQAGIKVGSYTSPHLIDFNERIRINKRVIDSDTLILLFETVERTRGDTELTFFEFTTLSAMKYFYDEGIDIAILEVGLGGRLDAVNIFPGDYGIITNISLDHMDWLGDTREKIAYEKAGIIHHGMTIVYGEKDIPDAIIEQSKIANKLILRDTDFWINEDGYGGHEYEDIQGNKLAITMPHFGGDEQLDNIASSLALCFHIAKEAGVDLLKVSSGIEEASLAGRFQKIYIKNRHWLLDVAHNTASVGRLALSLKKRAKDKKIIALIAIMKDKEAEKMISLMADLVDQWVCIDIDIIRAFKAEELAKLVSSQTGAACVTSPLSKSIDLALEISRQDDLILIFGSFYLVGPMLKQLGYNQNK
jgi:dihydrofolate synthase / folylpolyglutamate synthase